MTIKTIPTWHQCAEISKRGEASPLESFVFEFEPSNEEEATMFRSQLVIILNQDGEPPDMSRYAAAGDETFFREFYAQLCSYAMAFKTGSPDTVWSP